MSVNSRNNWICPVNWTEEDRKQTRLVCYRATLFCGEVPEHRTLQISADSRYKLFVNGTFLSFGPAKGDGEVRYYDTVDLAPFLHEGKNILAVSVLHCPEDPDNGGNHSLFRGPLPMLYLSEGEDLRCRVLRSVSFPAEEQRFAPLQIHEWHEKDPERAGWPMPEYDDTFWGKVRVPEKGEMSVPFYPENLQPRPIPDMVREEKLFPLPEHVIPARSEQTFTLDAGEETCAFLSLPLLGGKDAEIRIQYSECYVTHRGKGDRTDSLNGYLEGYEDRYVVSGTEGERFEPFWWRTFRYLQVTVRTAGEDLTLGDLHCETTGYPLAVKSRVQTSDETLSPIWDISLRTLKRCMHDTYIDCPYYEQLQYIMDTRSQILYTYAVSADDRLARKALEEFRRGQRPDGLINCSYPNVNVNIIPTFSIYYILMLHDHMMYFGDKKLIRRHLPTVQRILDFFREHLTEEGLVGNIGGVNGKAPFWSFIDWAEEWMATEGMPTAGLDGPITMESLLYLYGLQTAAKLEDYAGGERGEEYRRQADTLQQVLLQTCTDDEGFLRDGPHRTERSQHAQVFGILTDTLDEDTGRRAMMASFHDRRIAQCSVAMSFYLYRALEKVGLYRYTDRYWEIWRQMVRSGCTTCVEAEGYSRSECHAWGALALYELPSVVLGVRPAAPGYEKIEIRPVPGYLTHASGVAMTPRGPIGVTWKKEGEELLVDIRCSDGIRKDIITI